MNKSSLMKLDFDVLYQRYDQSTDPQEKEEMKKDPVGKKIKKLMGEGKPKKQAIAIALSMKEDGKLGSGADKKLAKNMRKKK